MSSCAKCEKVTNFKGTVVGKYYCSDCRTIECTSCHIVSKRNYKYTNHDDFYMCRDCLWHKYNVTCEYCEKDFKRKSYKGEGYLCHDCIWYKYNIPCECCEKYFNLKDRKGYDNLCDDCYDPENNPKYIRI